MITPARCFFLAFLMTLSGALGEPFVQTFDPGTEGYTAEKPAYLFFKEIRATRMGAKKLSFDITLQGDIPNKLPQGIGYRVYFDVADFAVEDPLFKSEDFQEDLYVSIVQSSQDQTFRVNTRDLLAYRSKLWESTVTSVRARKDKISFNVQSDLFGEPDAKIRMVVRSLIWGNQVYDRVDMSKIVDLPVK